MTDALNFALNKALDRFDVPPLSAGLADRIAAAATPNAAPFAVPRRDRRGMWRRGRQIVLGTLAVGLISAGAVASGFLGSVGIEVPVLTAMLAPKPKPPVAKPVYLAPQPPVTRTATVAPPQMIIDPAQAGIARPMLPAERVALREERRERRQVFTAEHPIAAAMIRERVREQLQKRAFERRQALMTPAIDPSLSGAGPIDLADRAALARAARRDRLVAEKMIDRRIQAREARMAAKQDGAAIASVGPPEVAVGSAAMGTVDTQQRTMTNGLRQPTAEQREARRARLQQMTPEQRTQLRERIQQRRAARLGRQAQN